MSEQTTVPPIQLQAVIKPSGDWKMRIPRMRTKAFLFTSNHTYAIKKLKGQQIFDFADGIYANDKKGIYPVKTGPFVEPTSFYQFHNPSAIGANPANHVATHLWFARILEQLSGGRGADLKKWLKYLLPAAVVIGVLYFVFMG